MIPIKPRIAASFCKIHVYHHRVATRTGADSATDSLSFVGQFGRVASGALTTPRNMKASFHSSNLASIRPESSMLNLSPKATTACTTARSQLDYCGTCFRMNQQRWASSTTTAADAAAAASAATAAKLKQTLKQHEHQEDSSSPQLVFAGGNQASWNRDNNLRQEGERFIPPGRRSMTGTTRTHQTTKSLAKQSMNNTLENAPKTDLTNSQPFAGPSTLGQQLDAAGGVKIPKSNWIKVLNIPPISSLEAMVEGIDHAMNLELQRGIVDLDAIWEGHSNSTNETDNDTAISSVPFISVSNLDDHGTIRWIQQAKLILSSYGRPSGWYLEFQNRSFVYALLSHARERNILCASRRVTIDECSAEEAEHYDSTTSCADVVTATNHRDSDTARAETAAGGTGIVISDATLRVENVPPDTNDWTLIQLFRRYDLAPSSSNRIVVRWRGRTEDGKKPLGIYFVQFASAEWAHAALREQQGALLRGQPIRLAPFPRQMLRMKLYQETA